MIKLSENKVALMDLCVTITAIENLDYLIENYKQDKLSPAYCTFEYVVEDRSQVQIDRKIMVKALESQRERLVNYLSSLGIDASE